MTRIILVRHGETDWNREEIFRGRADPPLNERGKIQAEATGRAISKMKIEAVYSSPLARSMETAQNIAGFHDLPVRKASGFIDIDFGRWQGLTHQEVKERYSDLYLKWQQNPHQIKMPGGESLDEIKNRAMAGLKEILLKYENRVVVIVSHRVVNKVLLSAVLGLDNKSFWTIRQDACAINIFEHTKAGFTLFHMNDVCHLKGRQDDRDQIDF